nr:ribosomal protein L23 [Erythrotrichia welwitschii]
MMEENQYSFAVDIKASKNTIKSSIEFVFNVKVLSVNTCRPPRKKHKVGRFAGNRPRYKKAMITLAKGSTIDLFV